MSYEKGPKKNSLHFSNSFPSPLPHTPFLSLFQKKNIEGRRKKIEENILYTLYFSLITTHTNASHFYLSWKEKNTKIL